MCLSSQKITLTLLLILIMLPIVSVAELSDAYLCISDKSTGFAFRNGAWQSVDFNVEDEKFLIRRAKKASERTNNQSRKLGPGESVELTNDS